jgi:hypothetical protein
MRVKPRRTSVAALRRGVAALVCALVVASCGNDGSEMRAVQEVGGTYELLAAAVDAGDRGEARRILQDLIRSVEEFREAGAIDAPRAGAILAAASEVSRALRTLPAPTVSPEPSPSPTSGETVDPEADDGGEDEGNGHGDDAPGNSGDKGNGNGKGKAHGHDKG